MDTQDKTILHQEHKWSNKTRDIENRLDTQDKTILHQEHKFTNKFNEIEESLKNFNKEFNTKLNTLEEDLFKKIEDLEENNQEIIKKMVAKELLEQSIYLQQRIDQFIFDAKIELKNCDLIEKKENK